MPFIGNQPAESYSAFQKQDFTTSATTSYTLDNPVTNANELALFINFVRQEPTTAYSASGTSLTLTSATSASDDMYCVYLGKAVQTVNPPNGSVGASQLVDSSISLGKLSATGTKDATTFLRGDNTFASAGGVNTPAFLAYLTVDQSISDNSFTKIPNNAERYDTDNAYDNSSNYRFTVPSGKAGKYYLYAAQVYSGTQELYRTTISLYINGARVHSVHGHNSYSNTSYGDGAFIGVVYDLSVGDYAEIYTFVDTNNGTTAVLSRSDTGLTNPVYFGGFKIIE